MKVGVDIGASALKIVAVDGEDILFTFARLGSGMDVTAVLGEVLKDNGLTLSSADTVALTGVGAEKCALRDVPAKIVQVPEITATGAGGTYLAGIPNAVVASLGTGTAMILCKDGDIRHVGGSGVGVGTARGLAKRMFGIRDIKDFFDFGAKGDRSQVDVQIKDLFSGTDTLPLDLTASNFAKSLDTATDEDWAAAIINMVLEVAGSHAALACAGFGVDTVVVTGGISQTDAARDCYAQFDRLYPQHYVIPPHSGFATAIGAARRA